MFEEGTLVDKIALGLLHRSGHLLDWNFPNKIKNCRVDAIGACRTDTGQTREVMERPEVTLHDNAKPCGASTRKEAITSLKSLFAAEFRRTYCTMRPLYAKKAYARLKSELQIRLEGYLCTHQYRQGGVLYIVQGLPVPFAFGHERDPNLHGNSYPFLCNI